ncbi:MAG: SRPBCC family protein [Deltaproteobacteria bacterium]|nr:SRPBCC family protein [Kofleriaceae bacterium]
MNNDQIRMRTEGINVPRIERLISIGAGTLALALGVRARSLPGILLAAAGGALVARGVTGRCPYTRWRALGGGIELRRSILIQAPRHEVYAVWRDLPGLTRFLERFEAIEVTDEKTSHWVAAVGPVQLHWLAQITDEQPGRFLAWEALPGGDVRHEGSIELSEYPDHRSTLLTVEMRFHPPAELVLAPFAGLVRALTDHQLAADLIRLRQFIETGEIATGASRPAPPPRERAEEEVTGNFAQAGV